MLLVWPKYIFLIKYTLINWNLSTDAKKKFHSVHSYIIFEIQKNRKKTNFTIFQQVWSTTKLCCRLKWAGLWKYHYKPLPIQSLVCSWAVVVPKYRRREFLEFLALAGAASKAFLTVYCYRTRVCWRITGKLVQRSLIQCVTHHSCMIPFTSVPSVNKLILQHLHLIWIVSVQFEIQNSLVSELPHFFFF